MIELGKISSLVINRFTPNGAYLALREGGEVLLPKSYLTGNETEGSEVEVFVYTDSEDRPVAVTTFPKAILDEFAVMEVKQVTKFGVFVDWGLPKDLFVPNSEIGRRMEEGDRHLVRVCLDFRTDRLIGSNKYEDFIYKDAKGFEVGERVEVLVFEQTDLGYKVLIEDSFEGLIYANEVFTPIEIGDLVTAYIKKVRDDGKLDLQLTAMGRVKYEEGAERILELLETKKFLPLHDKSSPESIKEVLGMSKKHFKQSIGQLYRARLIVIREDGISLA